MGRFSISSLQICVVDFSGLVWQAQITDPETDMKLKLQNETDHVSWIWLQRENKHSCNIKVAKSFEELKIPQMQTEKRGDI